VPADGARPRPGRRSAAGRRGGPDVDAISRVTGVPNPGRSTTCSGVRALLAGILGRRPARDVVPNFTITGYERNRRARGGPRCDPRCRISAEAAAWMAAQGHHMLAVVEPPNRQALRGFVRQREAIGLEVVPIGPDVSRSSCGRCATTARLPAERPRFTGDGVEVDFFGERTTLPAGPAPWRCVPAPRCCRSDLAPETSPRVVRPPSDRAPRRPRQTSPSRSASRTS
jgi:hypothetical protein